MKKIEFVSSDEDGEQLYYVIGKGVTQFGAWKAIRKFLREDIGWDDDEMPKLDDIEEIEMWITAEDSNEPWYWWAKPDEPARSLGKQWVWLVS